MNSPIIAKDAAENQDPLVNQCVVSIPTIAMPENPAPIINTCWIYKIIENMTNMMFRTDNAQADLCEQHISAYNAGYQK